MHWLVTLVGAAHGSGSTTCADAASSIAANPDCSHSGLTAALCSQPCTSLSDR